MPFIIEERKRPSGQWETMHAHGEPYEVSEGAAYEAVHRLQSYFGREYEYRIRKP